MSSWGHGRMVLNGAQTSSSSSSGTPASRLHPSCTTTTTSTSSSTSAGSCTESEADQEELQSHHHKDCGHTPDSPLTGSPGVAAAISLSDTQANRTIHHNSLPLKLGGGAMPSSALCHAKKSDHQVEDPRRRLACRNSNGMNSSAAIASAPRDLRYGEAPPVTLQRGLSMRDYHATGEEMASKHTKSAIATDGPSSTVFRPHCKYNQEAPAPPVRRPSWEEEVRQALTNSSLSGDGGRQKDSARTMLGGGGGGLQRSATVREHGSSHAIATALLLPPTGMKKVAQEGMPVVEEVDLRFMKLKNKLPARAPVASKAQGSSGGVGAKRSTTWSKVKSPGEQRWEEAEEFEKMMQRSRKQRQPIPAPRSGGGVETMRSQSMRVQNSSDGLWSTQRQGGTLGGFGNSSFYRAMEEQLEEEEEEDADHDEWVLPYRRSGGGDRQMIYAAEPARRSVGAVNGFRYSAAAAAAATLAPPPPAGMVLGRSNSLRDPAIGMVMECGSCGAPLRHRPQASCCRRSHCCPPHHAPCTCSAWNQAPPPTAGISAPSLGGSKKKFGTATSSAAGSMIRACRRLFGLGKKNPGHLHHHNQQHHHHQLHTYDS